MIGRPRAVNLEPDCGQHKRGAVISAKEKSEGGGGDVRSHVDKALGWRQLCRNVHK